jgi:UDP-2-acetamido-3-amino-2,3-dideoxy-glucuronate N-acetyltransferase
MPPDYFAHPKALIEDGARIGAKTRVWAFAHVLRNAEIGESCNICDHVFIEGGARLGNHVTVKSCVSLWEGVTAEDGVFIGPSCVFTNDLFPRSFLKRSKKDWLVPTLLKQGCTLGANATIVCGHNIGRFAFVAAGAVVTKEVADYAMVAGNPATFQSWICRCATKLRFNRRTATCSSCGDVYVKNANGIAPTPSTVARDRIALRRRRST